MKRLCLGTEYVLGLTLLSPAITDLDLKLAVLLYYSLTAGLLTDFWGWEPVSLLSQESWLIPATNTPDIFQAVRGVEDVLSIVLITVIFWVTAPDIVPCARQSPGEEIDEIDKNLLNWENKVLL